MRALKSLVAGSLVAATVSLGAGVAAAAGPPAVRQLAGTLRLTAGSCSGGQPAGSYLSVTYGTRAIKNNSSSCDGGAVTLLSPGHGGLSTQQFSPYSDTSFDGHGDATADTISSPARFDSHAFGIVTAARNLQDGPDAAPAFSLPRIYLVGNRVNADLRSVQILDGGFADSNCASASGYGCWLVGAERATGHYNPRSHQLTLQWFSGQSFTGDSAGTEIHLTGRFIGASHRLAKGTTVSLGTASFAAGSAHAADAAAVSHRKSSGHRRSRQARAWARLAARTESTSTGSPRTFLFGEVLVLANLVAFCALARRRSPK